MSESNNYSVLRLEKPLSGVGVLYLENPPLNLITLGMTSDLDIMLSEISTDDDIRVLIITGGGGGRIFCAGADIKEFARVRDDVIEKKLKKENDVFLKIELLSKPVICVINGLALGGGCEISMSCDIRIMERHAQIGLPEIKLGVFPGSGGLYRLPELVGLSRAMELMYTGEQIDAEKAHHYGLVSHIAESGKGIDMAVKMAERISKMPYLGLASIKDGVRRTFGMDRASAIEYNLALSDEVFQSRDCREGIDAFFEKRSANFE